MFNLSCCLLSVLSHDIICFSEFVKITFGNFGKLWLWALLGVRRRNINYLLKVAYLRLDFCCYLGSGLVPERGIIYWKRLVIKPMHILAVHIATKGGAWYQIKNKNLLEKIWWKKWCPLYFSSPIFQVILLAKEQIKASVNSPLPSTLLNVPCLHNFCHIRPVYTMEWYWLIFSCFGDLINCFFKAFNLILCPSSSAT